MMKIIRNHICLFFFKNKHIAWILLCVGLMQCATSRQSLPSKTSVIHSHNDYAQANPFFGAYQLKCGSIEADVFLKNGELIVAHESKEINATNTLQTLYLKPLNEQILQKNGYPLQLLIDLKTAAHPTLDTLVSQLKKYPILISKKSTVKIVISGSMPPPQEFSAYPNWIWFDGRFNQNYSLQELQRIAMYSIAFSAISRWKGESELTNNDKEKLTKLIEEAHQKGKKIRFWATPDTPSAWRELQNLKVDWIGTDSPKEVVDFLNNR